jgi:hypothetical protein
LEPVVTSVTEVVQATGKPVLLALRPPLDAEGLEEFLAVQTALVEAGLPVFHSLGEAAKAMSRVVNWGEARARSRQASRAGAPGMP